MKDFAHTGANSSFEELTPIEKGGKIENVRFASPDGVPVHLKVEHICNEDQGPRL